jgi:preprotein translocase SecE subunit
MAMAVADAPAAASESRKPTPVNLGQLGLAGTLYVILAYLAVAHGVPYAYSTYLVKGGGLGASFGLLLVVIAAAAVAIVLWRNLFPRVHGLRSAVAIGVGDALIGFLVVYCVSWLLDALFGGYFSAETRQWVGIGVMAGLAILWIRFMLRRFNGASFPKRMEKIEDGGWFTTEPFKKMQGLRIRRITMLSVMITVGLGIYYYLFRTGGSLNQPTLWSLPFFPSTDLIIFRAAGLTIPLLLTALTLWFSYRLVNYPRFAEFLINTEAEMAKVTWTSRKRLIRDTGVVLLTVLILSAFLYFLDIIWVIILRLIGVLITPPS